MAIGGYVGVNDTPRKIVDMYVGVNNQPRRVLKAYIGDAQNQPRLWYYFYPPAPLDYSSVYYMYGTGTFTTFGGRTYNKQNDGEAYVCSAWTPSGWTFHILVSQYRNAVDNWSSYNSSSIAKSQGSFIMYDHLWYFSMGHYDWQVILGVSPQDNHIDFRNNPNIPATNTLDAYEKMAKEFLKIIYE